MNIMVNWSINDKLRSILDLNIGNLRNKSKAKHIETLIEEYGEDEVVKAMSTELGCIDILMKVEATDCPFDCEKCYMSHKKTILKIIRMKESNLEW